MHAVVLETDRLVDFDRAGIDFDVDVQRLQVARELLKEVSYGRATSCMRLELPVLALMVR